MSETNAAPVLSGKLFLYERPELMNVEFHGELGVKPPAKPFEFCSKVRALPLTAAEVPQAARTYPVIFGNENDLTPLAVVGYGEDVNLFVDENGNWDPYAYVPGYVRRYPFALAGQQGTEDQYALVIDAGYEGIAKDAELKLFNGTDISDFSKKAMDFALAFEGDRLTTQRVMEQVKKFDLIKPQQAQYTPAGATEPATFAQYFGFEEQAIVNMSDADYLELRKLNMLPIIYAQLLSLANWRNLIARRMARLGISEMEAVTGQKPS
ncbi:MAG: SapC family protein [Parvularculaceae bacterium]